MKIQFTTPEDDPQGPRRVVATFISCEDTEFAKDTARRLGLFSRITADLAARTGRRLAGGLTQDEDEHVAVVAFAEFTDPSDNGWATIAVSPATEVNREGLEVLVGCLNRRSYLFKDNPFEGDLFEGEL